MFDCFKKNEIVIWISITMFALLYSQSNLGRDGLSLPFNVIVWSLAGLFVIFTFYRQIVLKQWADNTFLRLFSFYLVFVFLISLINTNLNYEFIAIYGLAFLGASLFSYAVTQYSIEKRQLKLIIEAIVFLAFLQAVIALIQVFDKDFWFFLNIFSYTPLTISKGVPVGSFQQVNMFATFIVVGVLSLVFLLLNDFKKLNIGFNFSLLLMFIFSYLIFISGSRAALLSLLVGLGIFTLLFIFKKSKHLFLKYVVLITVVVLAYVASEMYTPGINNVAKVEQKMVAVAQGADARIMLFSVGWQQFLDAPLFGQGLGNYLHSFLALDKGIDESSPLFKYTQNGFVHPHNELLFWLINSGVIVLLGLIVVLWQFVKSFRSPKTRLFKLSVLALSVPLLIEANLTYMFTLSAIHLFLLLFFLTVIVVDQNRLNTFEIRAPVKTLSLPVLFVFSAILLYSAWHTLISTKEVVYFKDRKLVHFFQSEEQKLNTVYLEHASNNPVYKEDVKVNMLLMVKDALAKEDLFEVLQYVRWSNEHSDEINDENSVKQLILSYLFLKRIDLAANVFTKNKTLLSKSDKLRFESIFTKYSDNK